MMAFSATVISQKTLSPTVSAQESAVSTAAPFLKKSLSSLLSQGMHTLSTIKLKANEKRAVLVMGGTGLVGGAVVRGLLSYPWFCVLVATRRPWCAEAILLKQAGAKIVEVDYNYKHSLVVAMQGVKCVFLHTMYWENYSSSLEIVHGKNAVEAAVEAGVEHLVFNGTNYVKPERGRVCSFLHSKLEIEEYIRESGLAFTIVVLPFYFENFLTVFRPFEITPDLFAMTLPLENCLISCACLQDMALCICKIIQQGSLYMDHKVTLAAEMLSVQQMTTNLAKGLSGVNFIDPELTVEDFMEFEFPGAKDLAAMFLFYQLCEDIPDFSVTRTLNPHTRTMAQWIADNKSQLYDVLESSALNPDRHSTYHKPIHLRRHTKTGLGGLVEEGPEEGLEEEEEEEETLAVPSRIPSMVVVGERESSSHNLSNNCEDFDMSDSSQQRKKSMRAHIVVRNRSSSSAIQKFLEEDFKKVQERLGNRRNAIAIPASPSPDISITPSALQTCRLQRKESGNRDKKFGPPTPDCPKAQGTTQHCRSWSLVLDDKQTAKPLMNEVEAGRESSMPHVFPLREGSKEEDLQPVSPTSPQGVRRMRSVHHG